MMNIFLIILFVALMSWIAGYLIGRSYSLKAPPISNDYTVLGWVMYIGSIVVGAICLKLFELYTMILEI